MPATASCSVTGGACAQPPDGATYASYRKDYYFPDSVYNEYTDAPVNGGRFHVALVAQNTGDVTKVVIDGYDTSQLAGASNPPLEWYHVWPHHVVAGAPLFVQFHSRDAKWDSKSSGSLQVQTTGGDAYSGTFPVQTTPAPLGYVTTSADYSTLLVHVKNADTAPHQIEHLVVDGNDVTSAACIPSQVIAPGAEALLSVPLCKPARPGDAWTVVVKYSAAAPAVAVGRVVRAHYPMVTWNNTSDCPFPGVNQSNYDKHVAAGIDTLFLSGPTTGCSFDQLTLVAQAASTPGFDLMVGDDFGLANTIADTGGIAAFMTGDESDGEIYDQGGHSNAETKAARTDQLWDTYADVPTYNGAKTNGNIGTFAGIADIQGFDFYIAGCAPHITQWGSNPQPRASYDFLVNARKNHMPLPTWLYSQGLSPVSAWKAQPAPQEIMVQGMSVVAAGGKGLMWFQSNMDKATANPASWNAMSTLDRMVRGVGDVLREGDVTGMAKSAPGVIVDMIRGTDALVVPVIDAQPTSGNTDLTCALASKPWQFATMAPDVTLDIPSDVAVRDVFEVGASAPSDYGAFQVLGRTLVLSSVALDNTRPVRLFVLASSPDVRARVAARMAY